jgi:hypothetical protein
MRNLGQTIVNEMFMPDSHFSAAIDYYCYF